MRAALLERNISANSASAVLGVSPATLSSWLNGATEPPVRVMRPIAEITGLAPDVLSELAGYLPATHRAASYQMQAAMHMQNELERMRRWVDLWQVEVGLSPATTIAGLLMQHSTDWGIELFPDVRGRAFRCHHATYIGIRQLTERPQTSSNDEVVEAVEAALGDAMALTGTTWRGRRRTVTWDGPPDHLLTTPHLERSRAPSLTPYAPAPITLPIIGITYAHAETVGALLADAWGYGYHNAAFAALERTGLDRWRDPDRMAQATLIRRWLESPLPSLNRTVWTFADYRAIEHVLPHLADLDVPVTAVVFAGPRLLAEAGATMWGDEPQALLKAQDDLRDVLLGSRSTSIVPVVIADDEVIDDRGNVSDELIWDAAVRAAWRLLKQLTPELTDVGKAGAKYLRGELGEYAKRLAADE